ncbi:ADP-heptose--LPS heptosyltransferase RfaF [Pantoea sp. Nvir]|uniref:ADP-heptose--LPS heptosyltransferase RfaF n=1 Tax=Pantoea sp. Nvir TaxID=2576760 RepID=UPI00135A15C9|nr:ADP-heptose--LPS heptosyltransferase RfaF [Pantoea sp. Nvir]MXP67010.1 ADP-heptose--LPS heptosyltransferase RfaF [Pantoea sp. Nvir]CAJ0992654.1 ADP-heptose--LPS heptosyltransferase 2 [Pantoea sp. Nvir]
MKILVIGPSWIGDMVMSHSLYRTLKSQYPDAIIDVIAPAWCCSLLSRMQEINQAITMHIGHGALAIGERYRLGKALRVSGYDRAYVLPNSFKSALVPLFAGIKRRIGWCGEMRYGLLNDIRMLDKTAFPLMVERYVALGYDIPVASARQLPQPLLWPQIQVEEHEKIKIAFQFHLSVKRQLIGFCPGAEFGTAKQWPYYHYAMLAHYLIAEGKQVVLLGSTKDWHLGNDIIAALPKEDCSYCRNLAGATQLEQVVILIAHCYGIVSNDSGLMHIAAALNRPLVALYGPSSPEFTPPLSRQVRIIRLISGYQKMRTGAVEGGYHQSLIDIQPQRVYQELSELLS